ALAVGPPNHDTRLDVNHIETIRVGGSERVVSYRRLEIDPQSPIRDDMVMRDLPFHDFACGRAAPLDAIACAGQRIQERILNDVVEEALGVAGRPAGGGRAPGAAVVEGLDLDVL